MAAALRASRILFGLLILLTEGCQIWALVLTSNNNNPVVNEFESATLSCLIESTVTVHPRIEWKKLSKSNVAPSHVYFLKKFTGDLEGRADIDKATLFIYNATRKDTATYRCEVTAINDENSLGELYINLTVQVKPITPRCFVPKSVPVGKTATLTCAENEGYPPSMYSWYRNGEHIPTDYKSNPKFLNSSYKIDSSTGTLLFTATTKQDTGEYHCVALNHAGHAECGSQRMEIYDINIAGIIGGVLVVVLVLLVITIVIRLAYKRGYFAKKQSASSNYKASSKADGVDYVRSNSVDDEGDFRHKSSFII
uniref:Junctional adhesion molecule 3b n=1 Tax=Callorhinchus milii TaxID=7868 RepID=V9L3A1_CALMI